MNDPAPNPPPLKDPENEPSGLSDREAYNLISDTVTGVNFRAKDNLAQAGFILLCVVVLAGVSALLAFLNEDWGLPWFGGALAGAFGGLVIGVLTSGFFLMVYRGLRHSQGKHK